MEELFLDSNGLVDEISWTSHIGALKNETPPSSSKEQVKKNLVEAVKKRIPSKKFGLMLSGGVDSSVIALLLKQAGADFCCYTVGIVGAKDLEWSQRVAKSLGVEHKHKTLSQDEIHSLMKKLSVIFSKENLSEENQAVLFGVACVELGCFELGKADGITHFFGGLGSEEIFAGYNRHDKSSDINEECWTGLNKMWKRDLVRDCALAKATGITVSTPFLDEDLILETMAVPGDQKIVGEVKKHILREIAEELGLAHEFAFRKKQAAQYGSKIDKAIERLAKAKGFEYKREYLQSLNSNE